MKKYSARTLLNYSTDDLWNMLTGRMILVFDDGEEVESDWKQVVYSSYAWDFHRIYVGTPLLAKHHVARILNNKRLSSDTHLSLLGEAMWAVYDEYTKNGETPESAALRDQLSEMVYQQTNRMYNDLSYRLEEHVVSLDIVDFLEVVEHKPVKDALATLEDVTEREFADVVGMDRLIESAYEVTEKVLRSPDELPNNPIAQATQSGLLSTGQTLQCLVARGFLTDTDSNIFRFPVTRSYLKGMRTLYNSMVESRSAAKSLLFSKTPLQQAEYFSRRLQLMSQIVRNLHRGDCGTQQTLRWTVRDVQRDVKGRVTRESDLKFLVGKYYRKEDGTVAAITRKDKYLIGQTIELRSVLHCAHPDPYGVCSTCFGQLSLSVPRETNLGHMCCTSMTQKSSQMVMSVKHLDGSSAVDSIVISGDDRKYLRVGQDDTSYLLAERLKGMPVKLLIRQEQAANLTDILDVKDVADLHVSRVSELDLIGFRVDGKVQELADCRVHMGRRMASMSYPLLRHIVKHRWSVDENGNYLIDMMDWDWNEPILVLPLKHINMSDHSRDIASLLESRVEDMQARDKGVSPETFLVELFNLVNEKLDVNLAVLEVILYAAMIRSAENFDYALPKPWTERGLGVMKNSMADRSLSAAMAYEGHYDVITNPMSFLLTKRVDHPMDYILMPDKVTE